MGTVTPVILKGGKKRFKAAIAITGSPRKSKTFDTRVEALRWLNDKEIELTDNPGVIHKGKTTTDAFERYAEEVSVEKKGGNWEQIRLRKLSRSMLGGIPLNQLRIEHAEKYIKQLKEDGLAANSIIREMSVCKAAIKEAVEWKWLRVYPWRGLKMPAPGQSRDILINDFEIELIRIYAKVEDGLDITTNTQETGILFLVAVQSAMRLGEMTLIKTADLNVRKGTVYLPEGITKTGKSRTVPLSPEVIRQLKRLPNYINKKENLFNVNSSTASVLFRRVRDSAGIIRGITFHDTRHRALTDLSKTFDVLQLCRISGHLNPKQLLDYFNESAEDMAAMLRDSEVET